jgi:SPASM domain peptide maturase of grasp-with-spasm system
MKKDYLNLYANCIPVKGHKRSIICDLQRQQFKFIPNSLYALLENEFNHLPVNVIREKYETEIVNEYIKYLEEHEFAFWCTKDEMQRFPKLSMEWDLPAIISNAIIDVSEKKHNFTKIFMELEKLGCKYIQIRFYKQIGFSAIDQILNRLEGSIIKSVQLIMPYSGNRLLHNSKDIIKKHNRISTIILTGSPSDRIIEKENKSNAFICFVKKKFNSCQSCGNIDPKRFLPTLRLFTEAQKHNTCLNRKISIDSEGNVKNCPSSSISFGNIEETSLIETAKNNNFQKNWFISKDKIDVCKECEFRYICVDCRVFIQDNNNPYSKPLKCNYDPFSATFKN